MTDDKNLKQLDITYWQMVRILWENDHQIKEKDAAIHVSNEHGYIIPSRGTLSSRKSRELWEKKNTTKSIQNAASSKADSNILKKNKKKKLNAANYKKNDNSENQDAATLLHGSAAKNTQQNAVIAARNEANEADPDFRGTQNTGVEENNREGQIAPVHDSDAIDLRADVLTRHRLQWPRLEQRLISGLDLLQSAGDELVQIADAVLAANLLDSEDDEKDKNKKMDSARVKAAKLKMYVAEKRVNVVVEAIRGVVVAQASERISWTMDDYSEDKPDNHTHNEEALDAHYKVLEEKARIEKEEMRLRSLTIRTVGNGHKDELVLVGQTKQNPLDDDDED